MEYFDFEHASHMHQDFALDECSSLTADANEQDAGANLESLFLDRTNSLPVDRFDPTLPMKMKLINNVEIEVVPNGLDPTGIYPMFLAKVPCDFCAKNEMDCFLASRGTLVTGCTCCISLYRECSFVHSKLPKGYISTFPGISEDSQVVEGTITERRKTMRSFEEARGRKHGSRFPRDAIKILKQWLAEHTDHPYPNEREKDELKQLTGLKRSQIANWLANARRRGKVRPISGPSSPMLGAIDIPNASNPHYMADLDPMDRWKASPPENEPASMTAIARAMNDAPSLSQDNSQSSLHGSRQNSRQVSRQASRASSKKTSSEEDSGMSMFQAPSVSSFETAQSSNSDLSFASSWSHRSRGSVASSLDRRRRKRAPMTQRAAAQQAKSKNPRIFQCTFCTDTFPAKYDWQRHEKSLHLALEKWTCCPGGGTDTDALTGTPRCVFCHDLNPSVEHLESHNFLLCQEKTVQERTFYRKDHLRQHLKLMHDVKFDPSMETWKSQTTEIRSACGFCPSKFITWQQRADHLAAHFRNGADMTQWSHGWGFEPHVERLVENAIPPYLIGFEKSTMNPYVARSQPTPSTDACLTRGTSEFSEPDQITQDSNCWGRLEQELTRYISEAKAAGKSPTDQEFQDYARIAIYGYSDSWDWTCADNPQWLHAFKFQHGMGEPCVPQPPPLQEVPVMAPYVVKGGLRTKPASGAKAARAMPSTPDLNMLSSSAVPEFGQDMELDFDAVDFSNLDLGNLGELSFDEALDLENTEKQAPQTQSLGLYGQGSQGNYMSQFDVNQLSGYTAGFP